MEAKAGSADSPAAEPAAMEKIKNGKVRALEKSKNAKSSTIKVAIHYNSKILEHAVFRFCFFICV